MSNNNLIQNAMNDADLDNGVPIEEGELIIENEAVITIDVARNSLVVYFDGDRNAVMEFKNDREMELCGTVLADPNFWHNFFQAFSGALKSHVG